MSDETPTDWQEAIDAAVQKFRDDPNDRVTQLNSPDGTPIGLLPLSVFWPLWLDLTAVLRRLVEEQAPWQPIESAPHDAEVLGWFPYYATSAMRGSVFVMRWNADTHTNKPRPYFEASGWVWGTRDQRSKQPTHWRPLPPAPAARRTTT